MAQADVLTLVDDLSGSRSDAENLDDASATLRYYEDVVFESGLKREGSCNAAFVAVVEDDSIYALPAVAVRLLAILFDDTQLRPTTRRVVESYDRNWRSRKGRPRSYLVQNEDVRTFRLVPVPAVDGETVGASTPFEGTFPENNLVFIFTENVEDVLPWDELWVALEVVAREFGRESDHYDSLFSQTCSQLAAVIRLFAGYDA